MPNPGIEPGSPRCKARLLTTTPTTPAGYIAILPWYIVLSKLGNVLPSSKLQSEQLPVVKWYYSRNYGVMMALSIPEGKSRHLGEDIADMNHG